MSEKKIGTKLAEEIDCLNSGEDILKKIGKVIGGLILKTSTENDKIYKVFEKVKKGSTYIYKEVIEPFKEERKNK